QGFAGLGPPQYIGAYNDAEGSESGLEQVDNTPTPSGVMEGAVQPVFYDTYPGLAGFDNTFDTALVDDAIGAQWDDYNVNGLPAGQSLTVAGRMFFDAYDGLALDPASTTKTTGDTATVNATVKNHGDPVNGAVVRWSRTGANSGS